MYGEGRITGVIEIFKRSFSFCERTGAFSFLIRVVIDNFGFMADFCHCGSRDGTVTEIGENNSKFRINLVQ